MQNKTIEGYRLSPQQKHVWQVQQADRSLAHHARCAVLIEGQLNITLLKAAIENVIERHEILRTTFECLPGMDAPLQVINESSGLVLREYDLSNVDLVDHEARLESLFHQLVQVTFDLEQSPTLHTAVVILSPYRHTLLLALPALCADRVSLDNLTREISRSYAACLRGEAAKDETAQYPDVSEILNDLLESKDTRAGRDYWQKQAGHQPSNLHLPFLGEPDLLTGFSPQSISLTIEPEVLARLEAVTRELETTSFAFTLACWEILLWRLTGQSELIVGASFDGRSYEGLSDALGLFAKYLPVRCQLAEDLKFSEILEQVRVTTSTVVKWQEYFTWEDVIDTTSWNNAGPLFFPACFDFTEQTAKYADSNVTFSIEQQYVCTERFKVKLGCIQKRDGLHLELHYDENLFEVETIKRLSRQFETLLQSAVVAPQSTISQLEIVGELEREQVLVEFNRTNVNHGTNNRLHVLFEKQAALTPDNIAVVFADQSLTYARLNARANRLAHRLREMGVGREVLAAICVERSLEMVVGLLGILKAGGAYVPLDSTFPKERLAFMLEDAGTSVLLTQQHLKEKLPAHAGPVLRLCEDDEPDLQSYSENPNSGVTSDNAAYVIYTSGSTGKPKGVVISHRAISNHMLWMQSVYPTTETDKILQRAPFSFDASVWEIFAPLIAGAQLILARPEDNKDMLELVQTMIRHEVTTLQLVPSILGVLLDEPTFGACTSLRRVFCGGERLSVELQEHFFTRMQTDLYNLYGPTEAAINATSWTCRREGSQPAIPIGHPVDNTQVYLLDAHLRSVPIGVRGALHIGGAGLARGYLRRADLTAERFIPNPFSAEPGARLYRTGDLARFRPEGSIEFVGRSDDQVKIRGFRIELGEIEQLLATYPAVKASVVCVREDAPGDKRLAAYFVLNQGWTATTSELRRFLNENLPEYMVPSSFVMLNQLPSLLNGKVDRSALPAPESHRPKLEKSFVAPLTLMERQLAQVWSQVLGIEEVGVDDNFFDLGGDSILAIRVAAKVNQSGLQLTPRQLFQNQTIAELAAVVGLTQAVREEQTAMTGSVPLSPIQRRFFELNQPDPHHFNQSVLLEVRQPLDANLLQRAVGELLKHHHALSLRFKQNDSGWQEVSEEPDGEVPFVRIDLTTSVEGQDEEQASTLQSVANELQASLNLSDGPLLRVALFDFGANKTSRLLFVVHHLAVDIVSWGILLEDLQTAYQQLSRNEVVQLSPRTTSFKQWAEKLKTYSQSSELRQELSYWLAAPRQIVAGLPVDYLEGANTINTASTVSVSLDSQDTQALLREVPKAYHTQIHEVLLTALVLACARWTGESSLLIDLEGHGREEIFDEVDLSRTVGWFTAVFPLLLSLEGVDGPGQALKAVKEQVRQVPDGGLGYGVLRYMSEDVEVIDNLDALPQAGVIFNHMGQFDHVIDESSPFVPAKESSGRTHSMRRTRDHLLEINGGVSDGRLQMFWTFSESVHQRTTIENVALQFIEELKSLILHCLSPEAGAYTPSDFPQAKLDDEKLNGILEAVSFGE
jgi:amino acid adenylation domain-containing protein/non-ribosomal peptide synthase protein (TIGR01720 family)